MSVIPKSTVSPPTATPAPSRVRRRGRARRIFVWALGLGLLALLVYGFLPKPIVVETAVVTRGPLTVTVLEEGKTRIRHRYVVSPPLGGMMERIPLRAGAPIKAGETELAIIRPAPAGLLDPRVQEETEARVRAAEAAHQLRVAQWERAREALALANKEKERTAQLRRRGAISEREFDQAASQAEVMTRELHAAEFAQQVATYELAQAQAAARQGTETSPTATAAPFVIKAPVDGFVLNVYEESARVVTPGLPLLEVGDPRDLEAEIELLSSDAVAIAPGAEVSIEKWGGGTPLQGRVSVIEPGGYTKISSLGVEEQRVKVRVDFLDPLPDGKTLGDRYRVEARIVTWHGEAVRQAPSGALFRRGREWMTFVLEGGKARAVKVEAGHSSGVMTEITSGVEEGQIVLLHPPDSLHDGGAVTARDGAAER